MIKRPRLRRTAKAEEDLIAIWSYIGRENPRAADRLLDQLDQKSALLARNPKLGMARDDIAEVSGTFRLAATLSCIGSLTTALRLRAMSMANGA